MVRNFKSKNVRGQWSVDTMKMAVSAVCDGGQLRTVARQFCVPLYNLRRQVAARNNGKEVAKQLGTHVANGRTLSRKTGPAFPICSEARSISVSFYVASKKHYH